MTTRAALYVRISNDSTGEALGVARQEEDCRALAKRHGMTIQRVYSDNDVSAWSGTTRPAFEQLLADAQAGQFDAIVVYATDRLYRRLTDLERIVKELRDVPVHAVASGEVDLTSADGRMLARIMGSVAQHASDKTSERVRRAMRQRAERGLPPNGGRRPIGWTSHDRQTLHPEEAPTLQEAARRVLAGESVSAVARDFGMATTRLWSILKSPTSAALSVYEDEVVGQGQWVPLWDVETHRRLAERFSGRHARPMAYPLSKVLVCDRCGTGMTGMVDGRNGKRRVYRCARTSGGCGGTVIAADPVEEHVLSLMASALDGPSLRDRLTRTVPVDAKAAARLAELEDRRSRLAVDLANGVIDTATWKTVVDTLDPQIEELRDQVSERPSPLMVSDLADRVENLPAKTQAKIARQVFEEIVVGPAPREKRQFISRLDVRWAV